MISVVPVALLVTGILAISFPATADVLVLKASGEGAVARYAVGDDLPQDTIFKLRHGEEVIVLVGKETHWFVGPGSFETQTLVSKEPALQGFRDLLNHLRAPRERRGLLGAVRGAPANPPSDHWLIDVTSDGPRCVRTDHDLVLSRGGQRPNISASIESLQTGHRHLFVWPQGAKTIPWPRLLDPGNGQTFRIGFGQVRSQITLRFLPNEVRETGEVLLWMAEQGCLLQLESLIAGL